MTAKQIYNREYYAKNRSALCAAEKARRKSNPDYLKKERARYQRRRGKVLARAAQYHIENREKRSAYNKEYNRLNRANLSAQRRQYRQANKATIRARNAAYVKANRGKATAWQAKWNAKNPGVLRDYENRRRALELHSTINAAASRQFYRWVRNQDYVTCTYCGTFITGKSIEIDHIVPLTRGGAHDPDNFCVSCRSCNASKGDNLLHEWPRCPEKFKSN